MAPLVLTQVAVCCDGALLGQVELLLFVQDYLLPLVDLGPAFAARVGGQRLLSLWVEAATVHGAGLDEYTGAALYEAINTHGATFLERAVKAKISHDVWTSVANFAVARRDRELITLLHERLPTLEAPAAMDIAAGLGDVELLQWLHEIKFGGAKYVTDVAFTRAAAKGHEDIVRWIYDTDCVFNLAKACSRAMDSAARNGQFQIVQWLVGRSETWWSDSTIEAALTKGHYEIAQWMYDRFQAYLLQETEKGDAPQHTINVDVAIGAAHANGDLRLLEWLRQRSLLRVNAKFVNRAKQVGHAHVLEYLEMHFPSNVELLQTFTPPSAAGGSITMAEKALKRRSLSRSAAVVHTAAKHGHLEFMKWFDGKIGHKIQRHHDPHTVGVVAGKGYLECVRFLVEHHLAFIERHSLDVAAANGHLEIIQWIAGKRDMSDADEVDDCAAINGHLDVVEWLHTNVKACKPSTMISVASRGHLNVVQWYHRNVPDCDLHQALIAAAQGGHLRVVQYLSSHCPSPDIDTTVRAAQSSGHPRVAKWLTLHRRTS